MILLLDAYNIIRHLFVHKESEAEARRSWFMRRMVRYFARKQGPVTQVMVVFDGGLSTHRQREIVGGVVQLYAGRGQSADDVLVEYAQRYGNQSVVVTNDRELQARCVAHGAAILPVREFDALVDAVLEQKEGAPDRARGDSSTRQPEPPTRHPELVSGSTDQLRSSRLVSGSIRERNTQYGEVVVQKYEQHDEEHDPALDELMHAGSVQAVHKPVAECKQQSPGGGSKKERRARQLKKRLGK